MHSVLSVSYSKEHRRLKKIVFSVSVLPSSVVLLYTHQFKSIKELIVGELIDFLEFPCTQEPPPLFFFLFLLLGANKKGEKMQLDT